MNDAPDQDATANAAEDEPADSPVRMWVTLGLFAVFIVLAASCTALWDLF
ncbi:MAG: hypothetical protein QM602_01215 [Microbacterium sp.]